jgi:hypothetical protein
MKRFACFLTVAVVVLWVDLLQAQSYTAYYPSYPAYAAPQTVYYGSVPTTTYYASAPTTVYYGAAPTTTYYASAPTTVYYGSQPVTTYYASSPTTVYYSAAPPVVTYYRPPLVGRGITRVGYYRPAVTYPVTTTYYSAFYPGW